MVGKTALSGKYAAYPEYKNSGVEWLGEVPADWLIKKLKYICSVTTDVLKKHNVLENKASNTIKLLQERRTALISAAVTGKIDVRGWRQWIPACAGMTGLVTGTTWRLEKSQYGTYSTQIGTYARRL